jgi:hypothetical protein
MPALSLKRDDQMILVYPFIIVLNAVIKILESPIALTTKPDHNSTSFIPDEQGFTPYLKNLFSIQSVARTTRYRLRTLVWQLSFELSYKQLLDFGVFGSPVLWTPLARSVLQLHLCFVRTSRRPMTQSPDSNPNKETALDYLARGNEILF